MKFIYILLFCFSIPIFSSDDAPIKGIATDVERSQKKISEFKQRDNQIWKFKLEVSDVITSNPSGILGQVESKGLSKKLATFIEEIPTWMKESEEEKERLMSLGVLIGQNKKIQREIIKNKTASKEQIQRSKGIIVEVNKLEGTIKELIKLANSHSKNLSKFLKETERWNKYLIKTIRKDVGANLFSWKINNFIISPIEEVTLLWNGIKYDIEKSFKSEDQNLISKHLKKIIFMSFLLIIGMGLILFLSDFLFSRYGEGLKTFHPTFSNIVHKIFSDRLLLIILIYLFLWIKILLFMIPDLPSIFNVITVAPILSYLWIRFGPEILCYLDKKETRKFFSSIMIIFIFFKMAIFNLSTESDALYLISSMMLLYLSYVVFRSLFFFLTSVDESERKNMSLMFRSGLYMIILFSGLLFASGTLEIIGFGVFARIIQGVVFNNLITFVTVWGLYHLISSYLIVATRSERRFFGESRNYREFISFIQNGFNALTVVVIFLFVIRSWSENIFIFDSIWDLKIFSVGEYKLTLWRPVGLVFSFYLIKGLYLLTCYSIDSFWVYQLNISRKYSPNIKTLTRYFYVVLFMAVSFGVLGFTYKNLVIFASALGVGIGFGLQNIVNNFISGIILLFERPIRVGDMIEVNDLFCRVCQIGIRSTIVETVDNSSIIIPNSEIISNRLTNWTLNSNIFAINCSVGVEYGSDTGRVKEILEDVLKDVDMVLTSPSPQIWFEEFGDSSLNFKIKFWINEPAMKYQIRSEVMHLVNKAFVQHKVKIPFPQRDLHLRSSSVSLEGNRI